ncbi:MAG TPA: hypothetical protein VG496_07395, partial [Myxococcales bacterium]|nr:hypothetical protein [Myxococcales bacterium]
MLRQRPVQRLRELQVVPLRLRELSLPPPRRRPALLHSMRRRLPLPRLHPVLRRLRLRPLLPLPLRTPSHRALRRSEVLRLVVLFHRPVRRQLAARFAQRRRRWRMPPPPIVAGSR